MGSGWSGSSPPAATSECHSRTRASHTRPRLSGGYAKRVKPDVPALLCDDEQQWPTQWQALKKARRQQLLDWIEEMGLDVEDFRGATRVEMIDAIDDETDAVDLGGWSEDDDSGYGPYSYFAHAMAKDG